MLKTKRGFTIVELLIVIVVIAVLAAISIVAYTGIQNRAYDSAVVSDLSTYAKKIALYYVDNNVYPGGASDPASLTSLGGRASRSAYAVNSTTQNNLWYCRNAAQTYYGIIALSKSGKIFYSTNINGETTPRQYTAGTFTWGSTAQNCDTMINTSLGWQYAGYDSSDTTAGPWRAWAG